jgi:hypothetical protein
MANTKVKITYVSSTPPAVTISPDPGLVKLSGRATWEVVQLPANYTYKVDFDVQSTTKGPFPSSGGAGNPSRGVYVGGNGDNITLVNDQAVGSSWKYSVIVYNATGKTIVQLDPAIQIEDN